MKKRLNNLEGSKQIKWVSKDAGIWIEGGRKYTLFSIFEEKGELFLLIAGESRKKRMKPAKITSLQQGRQIAEEIVKFLKKSEPQRRYIEEGL